MTIHDTAVDGNAPFDANALAKAKGGTPFKRPENGQFRPGSNFREFFFDETGDTNTLTEAGAAFGGFGAVFKLTLHRAGGDAGTLQLVYLGDVAHSGFDNCSFISKNDIVFVEDAGDTLHAQRNALDSAYIIDLTADYADPANVPARLIAEGRDPSATLDSAFGRSPASRTRATTRSPASTSRTATRRRAACWGRPSRVRSGTAGGSSGPSSTVRTSPGRSCRTPAAAARRSPTSSSQINGNTAAPFRLADGGGAVLHSGKSPGSWTCGTRLSRLRCRIRAESTDADGVGP